MGKPVSASQVTWGDHQSQSFSMPSQAETPVPDGDYQGDDPDAPSLFDFFRRLVITTTPSATPRQVTPTLTPTKTPRPTATPVFVPPPSDPDYLRLMIALSVIMVVVLMIGVWINREHNSYIVDRAGYTRLIDKRRHNENCNHR
jgi:hypothetical protein